MGLPLDGKEIGAPIGRSGRAVTSEVRDERCASLESPKRPAFKFAKPFDGQVDCVRPSRCQRTCRPDINGPANLRENLVNAFGNTCSQDAAGICRCDLPPLAGSCAVHVLERVEIVDRRVPYRDEYLGEGS